MKNTHVHRYVLTLQFLTTFPISLMSSTMDCQESHSYNYCFVVIADKSIYFLGSGKNDNPQIPLLW